MIAYVSVSDHFLFGPILGLLKKMTLVIVWLKIFDRVWYQLNHVILEKEAGGLLLLMMYQ